MPSLSASTPTQPVPLTSSAHTNAYGVVSVPPESTSSPVILLPESVRASVVATVALTVTSGAALYPGLSARSAYVPAGTLNEYVPSPADAVPYVLNVAWFVTLTHASARAVVPSVVVPESVIVDPSSTKSSSKVTVTSEAIENVSASATFPVNVPTPGISSVAVYPPACGTVMVPAVALSPSVSSMFLRFF